MKYSIIEDGKRKIAALQMNGMRRNKSSNGDKFPVQKQH
jgi:hypothetical protein